MSERTRFPANERKWRWAQRWDGQGKAHLALRNWLNHSSGHTACGLRFARGEENGIIPAEDDMAHCSNCLRTGIPAERSESDDA